MDSIRGTTLVELMVVVAIISLLAAIGVVNLLGAQDRARVTVARSDLRLLANGLASYYIDHNQFPPGAREADTAQDFERLFVPVALTPLTTPLAYMTTLMATDPFSGSPGAGAGTFQSFDSFLRHAYVYVHYPDFALYKDNPNLQRRGYALTSFGPDLVDSYGVYRPFPEEMPEEARLLGINAGVDTLYDPTNGWRSTGDLTRFGGNISSFPPG